MHTFQRSESPSILYVKWVQTKFDMKIKWMELISREFVQKFDDIVTVVEKLTDSVETLEIESVSMKTFSYKVQYLN